MHKGLKDLLALGWIDKMPRIYGVQSAGSDYMWQAWTNGEDVLTKAPIAADTVADSISAGLPRDRIKALAARQRNQRCLHPRRRRCHSQSSAGDGGLSGVFGEPAGATAYAGLIQAVEQDWFRPMIIVVINTGNGLKDVKGRDDCSRSRRHKAYGVRPESRRLRRGIHHNLNNQG